MKTGIVAGIGILVASLAGAARATEEEAPKMPAPQPEHAWLMQLTGEWTADIEAIKEPGKPPVTFRGTESVRAIGGFWIQAEDKGQFADKPFTGILTLGYDPMKGRFVGTWVDSVNSHLWSYQGTLDAARKVLTLEADGPCHSDPAKVSKFRETVEILDKDHRVFTSSMLGEDGKWVRKLSIHFNRRPL